MSDQAPCAYPGCDDGTEGDESSPRLTMHVICGPCRKRYAKVLHWLVLDFVTIKANMPAPVEMNHKGSEKQRRPDGRGHPRSWASDTLRTIAGLLNETEDDLREHVGGEPAVFVTTEVRKVQQAYRYLTGHFDGLCTHPAAGDLADALASLHSRIRGAMGYRPHYRKIQAPCPNCDLIGFLTIGDGEGTDRIECEICHESIREEMYDFFVRTLAADALDALVEEYDTRESEEFASKL